MGKYYIKICECGRIHFLDNNKINEICDNGGSVLHVCGNCGKTTLIWLENCGNNEFCWCSRNVKDENLNTNLNKIKEVMCTQGMRVPMKSRGFANSYVNGTFIDWEHKLNNREVDTKALINWIRDDEKLDELSNLIIDIHWKGTKFEKEYNK